jgi:hypothetical protein
MHNSADCFPHLKDRRQDRHYYMVAGIWLLVSTAFADHAALAWDNAVLGGLAILAAFVSLGFHRQLTRLRGGRVRARSQSRYE